MRETQETRVQSLGWEDPLEEGMATTSVFLPGKSYGQRSLAGYGPQDRTVGHGWATDTDSLVFSAASGTKRTCLSTQLVKAMDPSENRPLWWLPAPMQSKWIAPWVYRQCGYTSIHRSRSRPSLLAAVSTLASQETPFSHALVSYAWLSLSILDCIFPFSHVFEIILDSQEAGKITQICVLFTWSIGPSLVPMVHYSPQTISNPTSWH